MSVKITWVPNSDTNIDSYLVERAVAAGGPWVTVALVPHLIPGLNWDDVGNAFTLTDENGNSGSYYRLTAVSTEGVLSPHSAPFRAGGTDLPPPPLVNSLSIVVGNVPTLLNLGYRNIQVWRSNDSSGTWEEVVSNDHRIELSESVAVYQFYDPAGESYSRYRWRFSANAVAPFSPFSKYVTGRTQPAVNPDVISVGTANFIGINGVPMKRRVVVSVENAPTRVGQYLAGDDSSYVVESDDAGYLQLPLLKGMTVQIALEGTSVIHRLVVPSTATFDIFETGEEVPDRFTVQSVPPRLSRRTIS